MSTYISELKIDTLNVFIALNTKPFRPGERDPLFLQTQPIISPQYSMKLMIQLENDSPYENAFTQCTV